MHIHEMKKEIASLEARTADLRNMIDTIRANGNSLPVGRPKEWGGADKYDEPDGIGYYKASGEGTNMYSVGKGEYMKTSDAPHVFSEEVIQKYEATYEKNMKDLEKMRSQLARAERKAQKDPASKEEEIDDKPLNGKVTPESTREELEAQLDEIERNHEYIRSNTALVQKSDSLLGKIRRFLGNKNILGFADIQKRAEAIEKAIEKESTFIKESGEKTYEEALNGFKYGKKDGPVTIKLTEDVGYHGDHTKFVGEVTLKPFDHVCDEVGKRLYEINGSMDKQEYTALVAKYAKPKEDKFTQGLKEQVSTEQTFEKDSKMEELIGLETGSRLHDDWRAPRKKEDGTYEPRMKPTSDKKWIEAHGTNEVDIANTSFEDLPADWQYENLEAGKEAVAITGTRTDMTSEELKEASIKVHEAWCDRKRKTIEAARKEMVDSGMSEEEVEKAINDKFGWDMGLMVSFDKLSPDDQQKDTDHILAVMKVNKEIESGELTKAQMNKKFGDKARGKEEI